MLDQGDADAAVAETPRHERLRWARGLVSLVRRADNGEQLAWYRVWLAAMESLIEILGAVLLLSAFVLAQSGRLRPASPTYLLLNLAGSGILAFVAAVDGDLGFLLLEGVWASVSGYAVVRLLTRASDDPRR